MDTFINAIYLYDDKVLITFNYKEGTETVAFGEAVKAEKSSDMSARGAPNFERQIVRFGVLFLLCNPENSGLARSMHGFCTVGFFVGILCMGWNYLLSFNDVSMGDALRIEIDAATGHVFMIGPAVEVLQGEIALADRERSFNKEKGVLTRCRFGLLSPQIYRKL